jgi:phosphatidylserine/phosphatidylglycerophosphate/cardiolipin synthase-like enzyme
MHQHGVAHNKVMVIDGETVITGSLNFTKTVEERISENLLVIRDKATAEKYAKNWHEQEQHLEANAYTAAYKNPPEFSTSVLMVKS